MFLPNNIYNYIAVNPRGISRYDGIVQLIEAQTKDPVTGLMRGDKAPALNPMHPEQKAKGEEDVELLNYTEENGTDPASECGDMFLAALKGKGKGKGKNPNGTFTCFN